VKTTGNVEGPIARSAVMVSPDHTASEAGPFFSVVVPAYNDWRPLDGCLFSLLQQRDAPSFEVIVVDDGSREAAPEFIRRWALRYPLTILRQTHYGVSSARNRGLRVSRGSAVLFVDSDCRLESDCLFVLRSAIVTSREGDYFQLRLVGDCSRTVGRAEQLRLTLLQKHMAQSGGRIRYLNTAGFALRREKAEGVPDLFDPFVRRGEDTLLLADLMQRGELPVFVPDARVQHHISLSLIKCLLKDVRSGYLEAKADRRLACGQVRIRVSHRERLRILLSMWRASGGPAIGRASCLVLMLRQLLERTTSLVCRHLPFRPGPGMRSEACR
jgi:glycosyltransferase involved in cell wall biosynthesis